MAAVELNYEGLSLTPRKICNTIYREGWNDLINNGYEEPITPDNNGVHHIVAKRGRKQIGVISWSIDEAYKVPQVNVMLAYVRPEYRRNGIFKRLHRSLVELCKANGWGVINYRVSARDRAMCKAQAKFLGADLRSYIFQHEVL